MSKEQHSNKGFTLIELIVGMVILVSILGLAMNAFISASSDFNKDKKTIESSQSLSAVLELIGSDIRQAGEQINDAKFPAIEFNTNTDTGSMPNSSKIIVRRALIGQLTLCEAIAANQSLTTLTANNITVADNATAIVTANSDAANCDVATESSPLSVYRVSPATAVPTTYYPKIPATALPSTPTPLALRLPQALRNLRDYRCQIDEPNPTTPYDSIANAGTDFCGTPTAALETLRIAVANKNGQLLIFNQTNEIADSGNTADTVARVSTDTASTKKYQIAVNTTFDSGDSATANNTKNNAAAYPIGSPIYVIEERAYTLTTGGSLQVSVNGKTPETLVKKIDNFRVSARTYTNSKDKIVQSTPASDVCSNQLPFSDQPTTATADSPKYICKFNYFTGTATTDNADWKTIAGVKVELQAKYDGTGGSATASTTDTEKLSAKAEFFPRNVLSK